MGIIGKLRHSGDHGQMANTSRATGTLLPRGVAGPMDPREAGETDGKAQQDVMAGKMSSGEYHASSYAGDERINPDFGDHPLTDDQWSAHDSSQDSYYVGLRSSYGR